MRIPKLLSALFAAVLIGLPAVGQEFDPATSGSGWAKVDADGSCTFLDSGGRRLVTWIKGGAIEGQVDLSRLEGQPEAWVIDSYGNAWVVVGANLVQVDKKGKVGTRVKLPATVADLAWDPRGLVISYRAAEPYVEKREYKNGNLLWSWGARPGGPGPAAVQFRAVATNTNQVLVTRGASMVLDILDLQTGKPIRSVAFALKGAAAPDLELGNQDRGPVVWSTGKAVAFGAVPASQAPHARMSGLLLARIDPAAQVLEFLPTGLTEDHAFIGIAEDEAVFVKPKGGLVHVPIR